MLKFAAGFACCALVCTAYPVAAIWIHDHAARALAWGRKTLPLVVARARKAWAKHVAGEGRQP